jgi:hypothetical protein
MPTYLVFDCLVVNKTNVMHLNFRDRLTYACENILKQHTIYRLYQNKNKE